MSTIRFFKKVQSAKSNKIKEDEFKSSLLNLFDIAHVNVAKIVNEKVMHFLTQQRQDGRIGYIANIEYDQVDYEQVQKMKDELLQLHREKSGREKAKYGMIDDKIIYEARFIYNK